MDLNITGARRAVPPEQLRKAVRAEFAAWLCCGVSFCARFLARPTRLRLGQRSGSWSQEVTVTVEDMLWASQMAEGWTLTALLHRAELVVLDPVISRSTFVPIARARGSEHEAWAATVGGAKAGESAGDHLHDTYSQRILCTYILKCRVRYLE